MDPLRAPPPLSTPHDVLAFPFSLLLFRLGAD